MSEEHYTNKEILEGVLSNDDKMILYFLHKRCLPIMEGFFPYYFFGQRSKADLLNEFHNYLAMDDWHQLRQSNCDGRLISWLFVIIPRFLESKSEPGPSYQFAPEFLTKMVKGVSLEEIFDSSPQNDPDEELIDTLKKTYNLLGNLNTKIEDVSDELRQLSLLQGKVSILEKEIVYLRNEISQIESPQKDVETLIDEMDAAKEGGKEFLEYIRITLTGFSERLEEYKRCSMDFEEQLEIIQQFKSLLQEAGEVMISLKFEKNEGALLLNSLQKMVQESENRDREMKKEIEVLRNKFESHVEQQENSMNFWRRIVKKLGWG